MDDERIIALAQHLNIELHLIENNAEEITELAFGSYQYGSQEYMVLTDDEADKEMERNAESHVEDELYSIESHLRQFIDEDKMIEYYMDDDRGNQLAWYDNIEHTEEVDGTTYYIYRTQ